MSGFVVGGGKIDAEGFLKFLLAGWRPGYALGLTVTQRAAGANMTVDINVDSIRGFAGALLNTSANVPYFGYIASTDTAAVTTADPTNPRVDSVVAYVDLSVISTSITNNTGGFKFKVVAGTPAASSPAAPNAAAIQSSVGAGNPYAWLGDIAIGTPGSYSPPTSVINAMITDRRTPMAFAVPYLYGGAFNTKGHLVPNVADDTVALLNAVQALIGKTLSLTGNTATGNILSNPNKFSVYRTAAFSLPGGSATTKIAFDTKEYDTGSNFDATTNFRYTAPVAEFVRVSAGVGVLTGGAWTFNLLLYKNGVIYKNLSQGKTNSANTSLSGGVTLQLAATDYLEIFCFSNDTGANNLNVGQPSVWFCGELVSHT